MAFEFFFLELKKNVSIIMSLKFVKKCIALNEDDIKLRDEETKIKKKKGNAEKISEIGLEKALQSSRRTLIELSAGANVRCVPLGALVLTVFRKSDIPET